MSCVHIAGLVLCGGRSRRMGTNKAHLLFHGRPLWEHMLQVVRGVRKPSPIEHSYLSGTIDGQPCIPDAFPGLGPLGGIYSVIRKLREQNSPVQWLIVVPVDMPYLKSGSLEHLLEAVSPATQFVHHQDFLLPLVCRVTCELEEQLHERLMTATTGRRLSIHNLLQTTAAQDRDSVCVVPTRSDHREFLNANTPHDWKRLEQRIV